jgi:hypothetical protein
MPDKIHMQFGKSQVKGAFWSQISWSKKVCETCSQGEKGGKACLSCQ